MVLVPTPPPRRHSLFLGTVTLPFFLLCRFVLPGENRLLCVAACSSFLASRFKTSIDYHRRVSASKQKTMKESNVPTRNKQESRGSSAETLECTHRYIFNLGYPLRCPSTAAAAASSKLAAAAWLGRAYKLGGYSLNHGEEAEVPRKGWRGQAR